MDPNLHGSGHVEPLDFTGLLDQAHIGAVVTDSSSAVVWVNRAIETFLGLRPGEVVGRHEADLLERIEDRVEDPAPFERAAQQGPQVNRLVERSVVHVLPDRAGDRKERWLEHWSQPIDEGPHAGGRIQFYYDVTELRRSQGALGKNEEEFSSLVDAVEEYAIFRLDRGGHVASWNQGARKIKGYDRGEILGKHLSLFYTEQDRAAGIPEHNLEEAARKGWIEDEGWRVRKDGSRFWANVTITATENARGTPTGFLKVTRDMTDRHQSSQALTEERDLVRKILDTSPVGIMVADTDGSIVQANTRAMKILGLDQEGLAGYQLGGLDVYGADGAFVPPDQRPPQRVLATGEPASAMELRIGSPGERARWISVNAAPVLGQQGGVRYVVISVSDITQAKAQAHRLEQQRDELRSELDDVFERIDDAFYAVDQDGNITYANDALLALVDMDRATLVGANFEDVLPDDTHVPFADLYREARQTGEMAEQEIFHEPAGAWLHVSVYPSPTGQSVYLKDVTERRETQERLERRALQQETVARLGQFALSNESDELMHECARAVADVLGNAYCKILDLDPEAEELLLRQGVGWRDGIVGHATVKANTLSQAGYTLLSKEPVVVEDLEHETRFTGPELLTSHDVKSGISTIIGAFEDPWGILGTHDTEHRRFSGEDVNFVQSVANILADAIKRDAYEHELEGMIGRLEESNDRLEQFAYAASHDLQEPLRMISSYLALLEDRYEDELDEDAQEFIEFAVDGANRMHGMVEGLLAYARVDTQGASLEPVDVRTIFDDVITDLSVKIRETGATVTTEELPTVLADANQLRQLFQNLIRNALIYAGDQPPRVHVSAARNGSQWVLSVQDHGIGIEPNEQNRIFELFHRAQPREHGSGSGIGLAICKRIVQRHGGEIWVDSEPGRGATLSFTLASPGAQPDDP